MSREIDKLVASLPASARKTLKKRIIEDIECITPDIAGISRGKSMPANKFARNETTFLPISIFYQTITGEYVMQDTNNILNEHDVVLRPDISTARIAPWADDVTLQVIHNLETHDGQPIEISPRNVLKKVVDLYKKQGWRPVISPEIEFYLIKPNIDPNNPIEPPTGRTGRPSIGRQAYSMSAVDEYGPVIDTIYDYAEAQNLEIDTIMQEGGAGQIEINLLHGDPIELADQVFYFKRSIREAALKNKMFATFMAMPMRDEPGSSMHIHQNIFDIKTGKNLFSKPDGSPSEHFYHFIGGSQTYLLDIIALLAPYVNSYRRFRFGDSAPSNLEWSMDNRSTGFRIPLSSSKSRRVENRLMGIDCNPYLAIASSLLCGYLGMTKKTSARDEWKSSTFEGCVQLPRYLEDALELLSKNKEIHQILGKEFCELFVAIKREEAEHFNQEISPWERQHLLLNV